jgi:hypothetical protein
VRRIFGPKMEEVAGGWRKLHEIGRTCSMKGEIRNAYNILVGKREDCAP